MAPEAIQQTLLDLNWHIRSPPTDRAVESVRDDGVGPAFFVDAAGGARAWAPRVAVVPQVPLLFLRQFDVALEIRALRGPRAVSIICNQWTRSCHSTEIVRAHEAGVIHLTRKYAFSLWVLSAISEPKSCYSTEIAPALTVRADEAGVIHPTRKYDFSLQWNRA